MTQPGTAAVLSLIIPGAGQIYNGDFLRGIFWLIVTPGLWIGSGGTLGRICHVIAAYTAHSRGKRYMRGELAQQYNSLKFLLFRMLPRSAAP